MSPRLRKRDTTRTCKKCAALVLPGEVRCICAKVGARHKPAPQGSAEAAHYFQLFKSIRSGSWAKTNYKPARNLYRDQVRRLYAEASQRGWEIVAPRSVGFSPGSIVYFIFRCELAHHYWRSEFDMLMGTRMELWAGGCDQRKTCDILSIPRESLVWLDGEIRTFVWFPPHAHVLNADFLKHRRKMKAGVAADIIRRRQKGYEQTQSLQPEKLSPSGAKMGSIYEREPPRDAPEVSTGSSEAAAAS
jgi:hypothetical protein